MKDRTTEFPTFRKGDRVQLHPATDGWMRGARFGTVTSITAPRECWERGNPERYLCRIVRVKLDNRPRVCRVHPANLLPAGDA
jgi:hypothetical protein